MRKAAERLGRDHYISPGSEQVVSTPEIPLQQETTTQSRPQVGRLTLLFLVIFLGVIDGLFYNYIKNISYYIIFLFIIIAVIYTFKTEGEVATTRHPNNPITSFDQGGLMIGVVILMFIFLLIGIYIGNAILGFFVR